MNDLLEHSDLSLMFENEAVHDICQNSLEIERPGYENMNRVIAQALSIFTKLLRHDKCYEDSMEGIRSLYVPFPRSHFVTQSYAPFIPIHKQHHEVPSANTFTKSLSEPHTQLSK